MLSLLMVPLLLGAEGPAVAAPITVIRDGLCCPYVSGSADITTTLPSAGNGSIDLSVGQFLAYEYPGLSGGLFGTWGELTGLLYDGYVTGSNLQRPQFALRLNYYGDSDTFFVTGNLREQAADTWVQHNVFGDWFLQTADGLSFLPESFAAIPADTPITGIHFRDVAFLGDPYVGFADNATLRFAEGFDRAYNFEAQAIPEPTSLLLFGTGLASLMARGRFRRKT
ncbi:MAG: PEP-CTERM sorting domain-containing protein [Vicinamibacterales bacterium]